MSISNTSDITCTPCNTIDIGTIIRESDCIAHLTVTGEHQKETLARLTELARTIGSNDACDVVLDRHEDSSIAASFTFSCTAQKLIFEMRARKLV